MAMNPDIRQLYINELENCAISAYVRAWRSGLIVSDGHRKGFVGIIERYRIKD